MQTDQSIGSTPSWLDRPLLSNVRFNAEILLFLIILGAAVFTRLYDLGSRVMSHDETSHVYFSWLLYRGQGYAHDPVTHGPFQFHIVALSYFLFGDNDLTARLPAALFSIATIAVAWIFRRYLGRVGALLAALMLLISPFLLYYGRYARNEAFIGLYFLLNIWAILRYLQTGKSRYMLLLTIAIVMHIASKETSYIYIAQTLLFLGIYFVYQITQKPWPDVSARNRFLIGLILGFSFFALAVGLITFGNKTPAVPTDQGAVPAPAVAPLNMLPAAILIGLSVVSVGVSLFFLVTGYGADALRQEHSFSLMLVLLTLVLPQLSPFAMNFLGIKIPVNATEVNNLLLVDIVRMALVILPFFIISILVGWWWNLRQWLINAGIFYGIFTVLYTTFFTNGAGFFTGMVGSLGYWLAQQAVQRGSQPSYYYLLIQIPIYEYLPALGVLLAVLVRILQQAGRLRPAQEAVLFQEDEQPAPVFALLAFWTVTSALAYTVAGEKMPWLTFHIALPMILLSAWGLDRLIQGVDWGFFSKQNGWLSVAIIPVFLSGAAAAASSLVGPNPPFQGQSLAQLSATSTFLTSIIASIAAGILLAYLMRNWLTSQMLSVVTLFIMAIFGVLTARTAFRAAYINYDNATEYLVYAHSAPGVKIALSEIEDLSKRLTGTLDIAIAYDNDTTYPYWWYLRNYPKQRFYGGAPSRDLRDAPVILVGDTNYARLEPIVASAYYQFNFIRIWWPNQDYFDLTWERIAAALRDPQMRLALFKIWLNRDYSDYARLTGKDMSLSNWYPSGRMRLYIRKDIANQIWKYGSSSVAEVVADPYEGKLAQIHPDHIIGNQGNQPGQFNKPRGVAVAPDGSLYVADTENHRIQHLSVDGTVLQVWGRFADVTKGEAPGGTFNEPWGIAVGPDGSVYVTDTWNHRVQKFSATGEFITMWGFFGQAESPLAYWGPRAVAVDNNNHVYITDTGNKRVVIYDSNGGFITEFGLSGFQPGEFSEPVGIGVGSDGSIYIADTWNQRIQVMGLDQSNTYQPLREWEIVGWYGQSLDNKPYITMGAEGHVFVTDPEGYHILEFTDQGELVRYWGDFGTGIDGLNLPNGLAADAQGGLWVADSGNHRIVHYSLP